MPALARRSLTELIGTTLIVFFGCAAPIMDNFSRYNLLGTALMVSFAYVAVLAITLGSSQGFVNPAATIGLLVARRLPAREAAALFVSQVAGAVLGGLLVKMVLPANVGRVIAYGTPTLNNQLTFGHGVALEALLTFFLMSVILQVQGRPQRGFAAAAVGFAFLPATLVAGSLTGGVLNPARALGPALVTGTMTAQAVWWVGPIVGAVIAGVVWSVVGKDAAAE
jgi:glycerol uptake facilitator-like aquaporin